MKKLSSITPIRGGPSCLVSNGMGGYDLARPQASHLCHDLALAFLCRAVRHPVRSAAGGDGRGLSVQAAGRTMGGTRFPELADRARHRAAGTTGFLPGGLFLRTFFQLSSALTFSRFALNPLLDCPSCRSACHSSFSSLFFHFLPFPLIPP